MTPLSNSMPVFSGKSDTELHRLSRTTDIPFDRLKGFQAGTEEPSLSELVALSSQERRFGG